MSTQCSLEKFVMTFKPFFFALFLIAIYALGTGVRAHNVYKCGNSYSQMPCSDEQALPLDDSRNAAQKRQTDQATRSTAKLADQLEKERLALEKQALPARPIKRVRVDVPVAVNEPVTRLTPKRAKSSYKKPQHFIAEIPGTETNAVRKKTVQKMKQNL
jgi:hypothetical protein